MLQSAEVEDRPYQKLDFVVEPLGFENERPKNPGLIPEPLRNTDLASLIEEKISRIDAKLGMTEKWKLNRKEARNSSSESAVGSG